MKKITLIVIALLSFASTALALNPLQKVVPQVRVAVSVRNITGNYHISEFTKENITSTIEMALVNQGFVVVDEQSYKANMKRQDNSYSDRFNPRGRIQKRRLLAAAQIMKVDVSINFARATKCTAGKIKSYAVGKCDGGHFTVVIKADVNSTETSAYAQNQIFLGRAELGLPDSYIVGASGKIMDEKVTVGNGNNCNDSCRADYARQAFGLALTDFANMVKSKLAVATTDTEMSDGSSIGAHLVSINDDGTWQIEWGRLDGISVGTTITVILPNGAPAATGQVVAVSDHSAVVELTRYFKKAEIRPGLAIEVNQ